MCVRVNHKLILKIYNKFLNIVLQMQKIYKYLILILILPILALSQVSDSSVVNETNPDSIIVANDSLQQNDSLILNTDSTIVAKDTVQQTDSLGLYIASDSARTMESEISQIIDPEGYRGMHWGMTMSEVKNFVLNLDTSINYKNFDPITSGFEYTKRIVNSSALISYQFDYDRLYIIRIKLNLKSNNKFDYLDKYDEIQKILKTKYGNFTRTGFSKISDNYLSTIESVILGYAKKYTLWEFERSFINLMLTGKNRVLEIKITYGSKPIINEIKDRKEILKFDDF